FPYTTLFRSREARFSRSAFARFRLEAAILQEFLRDQTGVLTQRHFDLAGRIGIVAQELLGVLASLTETLRIVGEPCAGLLDHAGLDAEIDEFTGLGHAFAIHDVELDHLEGRSQLVLDHLDAGLVADHLVAILDGPDAADIETHGSIEFERVAASGRLGGPEHDADLHAYLVDEDD